MELPTKLRTRKSPVSDSRGDGRAEVTEATSMKIYTPGVNNGTL